MKIGISSYSFSKSINSGGIKQIDVIAKSKDMGFDGIEFSTLAVPDGETLMTYAPLIKKECDRVGIEATNYTIGADFINGSGGDWEAEVERLKDEIKVASILGVKGMRHDATSGFPSGYAGQKGFDYALPVLAKACRAVTEYAAGFGIRTMVENHGFFCQDSERVEKLVNEVNHPNFGVLIDIGNFICVDENPVKAVGRLIPYAFNIHAKDFHLKSGMLPDPGAGWFISRGGNYLRGSIIGHGEIPVKQCLKIIQRAGYTGFVSIEFEGLEETITGISLGQNNLKRFLHEIEN